MIKDIWKQKRFRTWDEAFRGLTPVMRQQSVRVAEYTQVLFEGVCKSSFYLRDDDTPVYIDESYKEVAYKCGFYHQIGKALDPESYPAWRDDFTDEEKSRYCKYVVDGKELVARLQGERNGGEESVPKRMIQDACEFHMERWDGSGFPYGYQGNEISLIAQIVGLAKEIDRLVCERKTETPFEDAVDTLLTAEGILFSEHLMDVFKAHQTEIRNVYKKYIHYTKIMPKTVPLVDKRPERPFGLDYRQIVMGSENRKYIFEAVPWFGGILNKPDAKETAEEIEEMLMRIGLLSDVSIYLLYEAADLLARIKNCEMQTGGVLVPMFSGFFQSVNQAEKLQKLYEDTAIDEKKLLFMVQEQLLRNDRSVFARLTEYIELGVTLVLGDYHPDYLSIPEIRDIGFTHVRLAKDYMEGNDCQEVIGQLRGHGIKVIDWPAGDTCLTEDELIRYLLG